MKGVNRYDCESYFASEKICRVIECFASNMSISLDDALAFFYHSEVYRLISEGVSDMHCMSDEYLAEELKVEYNTNKLNE